MHGGRLAARAALLTIGLGCLSSCVSLIAKKNIYAAAASSPVVRLNGADIRIQLKPEGKSGGNYAVRAMVVSAAITTLDGPFRWRIEGVGQPGKHEYLVGHRIRIRTGTSKRDDDELTFLPTEIIQNIGKTPANWDEKGWD
jgi:hypothetical protein